MMSGQTFDLVIFFFSNCWKQQVFQKYKYILCFPQAWFIFIRHNHVCFSVDLLWSAFSVTFQDIFCKTNCDYFFEIVNFYELGGFGSACDWLRLQVYHYNDNFVFVHLDINSRECMDVWMDRWKTCKGHVFWNIRRNWWVKVHSLKLQERILPLKKRCNQTQFFFFGNRLCVLICALCQIVKVKVVNVLCKHEKSVTVYIVWEKRLL